MFKHFRGDWAYPEPNFFRKLWKKFSFKNVHFGPIRCLRFFKILINYSRNLHFKLVFLRFSKIIAWASWASLEIILAHTAHTRKWFNRTLSLGWTNFCACSARGKILTVFTCTSMLSIRGNDDIAPWAYEEMIKSQISRLNQIQFQKSHVTGPGDHEDSVSVKKVKTSSCLCHCCQIPPGFQASPVKKLGSKLATPPPPQTTEEVY